MKQKVLFEGTESDPWRLQTAAGREAVLLAPYAMHSADSLGRKHAEAEHPYRGPYQRDRDRIVHSAAYRRLSGKMQVFTGDMGDYHRTRLTHTYEVASIARTIGRALRLNEDLIEALALFHDIGHPPFGHAGEDALDELLADQGGFSHNRYAMTLAEDLEGRYAAFQGLNLTREVLAGQETRAVKKRHRAATGDAATAEPPSTVSYVPPPGGLSSLLEVQVVDLADSVTYDSHDCDDAVKLGLVTLEQLEEIPLVREASRRVRDRAPGIAGKILRLAIVHELLDLQVSDVLRHGCRELLAERFTTSDAVRQSSFRISLSPELAEQKRELERFLYQAVYRHPRLVAVRGEAQLRLRRLFLIYQQDPSRMPPKFQGRIGVVGLERAIGDYLAGMTDRFCDQQYRRYFSESPGALSRDWPHAKGAD